MKIKEISKNESGSTAVEASIVVPIVIMIIFVMMYMGFIMYQQTALTVIANETAASIGQIYSTNSKDPFIGFTTPQNLSDTDYYRTLKTALNIHGSLESEAETKSNWYAQYRITSSRLYKEAGDIKINTEFEKTPGMVLQKTAVVTVEATYDLPFIRFFGIVDSTVEVSAVGRAQCFDILDYGSTMSLATTMAKDIVDPFAAEVQKIFDAIKMISSKIKIKGEE
ncbi:MAG: pilus assembly protein [Clostridia bacterium]|nr:pilus assembly protein [Clostridia bacterium]